MIDFKSKFGRKTLRRLKGEYFIWLTTVDTHGAPQPRPIWFIMDGDDLLLYSKPNAFKLRHIVNNPNVSLHFNTTDEKGENDIMVFLGEAEIYPKTQPADKNPAYLRKYRAGIKQLGATPKSFAEEYSTVVRIKLTSLRGW